MSLKLAVLHEAKSGQEVRINPKAMRWLKAAGAETTEVVFDAGHSLLVKGSIDEITNRLGAGRSHSRVDKHARDHG